MTTSSTTRSAVWSNLFELRIPGWGQPDLGGQRAGERRRRHADPPGPAVADSRSHSSVLVTGPIWPISVHIPDRMSPACRDGIIVAARNRENANVITSTGNTRS
jgi:hypothetical protein